MHESAIAASVADALRRAALDRAGPAVHLTVRGGRHDASVFDAALRLHLAAELPAFDLERLSIGHPPCRAACAACATWFLADDPATPCPACGGAALLPRTPESVELGWSSGSSTPNDPADGGGQPDPVRPDAPTTPGLEGAACA